MGYEYVKETPEIKDKTDKEKKMEIIISVIKTRNDLENARKNYDFAEDSLIDYYLYEIKANQSKLDYLINKAKQMGIELDISSSIVLKNKKVI